MVGWSSGAFTCASVTDREKLSCPAYSGLKGVVFTSTTT